MDYGDILKRAWSITWRHKALWVLGLFAGVSGGSGGSGGGGGTGYDTGSTTSPISQYRVNQFLDFLRDNLIAIVVVIAILAFIGLVMWVLGVAARGGLIHLANEAAEGHTVRLRDGWGTGLRNWWRVFAVEFLTALPLIVFGVVVAAFVALLVASAVSHGVSAGSFDTALASLTVTGLCFFGIFAILAAIVGTILGIVAQLALRYVVLLHGYTIRGSIGQGWRNLWGRRGAFLMFLVTVGTNIAFGVVVAMVAGVFAVPAAIMFLQQAWITGSVVIAIGVLVLMLPSAIYATFHSAMWTVFFRKMTGIEPQTVPNSPIYTTPYPTVPGAMPASVSGTTSEPPIPPVSADA